MVNAVILLSLAGKQVLHHKIDIFYFITLVIES